MLGLAPGARPQEINRAWRLWARVAHPDRGGDRAHFEQLQTARRVLLTQARAPRAFVGQPVSVDQPTPRPGLREVLRAPRHSLVLACALVAVIALAGLPRALPDLPLIASYAPACVAASVWAGLAQRGILMAGADRGHRIVVLSALWFPVWGVQILLALALRVDPIAILPLTAVPYAAAIAVMNAGAGLWRPIPVPNPGQSSQAS